MAEFDPTIARLARGFSGRFLRPDDPDYDEVRRIHNGAIDKRPALIAQCADAADIAAAIAVAREHDLEVSVRGGGHNVAGRAVVDDGLMIDLSRMKGIAVDPEARTVRAQGGVTWGEFNEATQAHGLATTGGIVTSTGIAGLTLGGGIGWLMGKYGLAVDNLRSAEVVTADGRILTASEDENPELFWAIRGGGGNFGVVSSFEYRLHLVGPTVIGGLVAHPVDRAPDVLRFYRDLTVSLPDELTAYAALTHAPDGSGAPIVAIFVCHCGPLEEGESATLPVKEFGSPVMDMIGPMPYAEVNALLDAAYPRGARNYWKSSFLSELSDDAIDTMIGCFADCPSPNSDLILEHVHGAVSRVGVTDTAFPHRADGYSFLALGQWTDPADDDRCIDWTRRSFAAMRPFLGEGRYVNYLDRDEEDPVAAAYGPNYARLRKLKAKYDPDNFFKQNQNIRPAF